MVTKLAMDLFNDPFFIGFGKDIQRMKDNTEIFSTNYPPHNLIKINEDSYLIELAVAGFSKEEVDVNVSGNQLEIDGLKHDEDETSFIHKGIASRNFRKFFALGEYMEVTGAEMKDGMLSISVDRIVPEEKKPKTIKIK
jgi:molecular chaperone IbpA